MVHELPDIYEYLDYHAFLRDAYASLKTHRRFFSYRYIARKIGMDHSLVVKVLQGKRHLGREHVSAFAELLNLNKARARFFAALVDYGRAEKDADIRRTFEKVLSLRPTAQAAIEASHYAYFQKWYHAAIRSLLEFYPFDGKDYASLGKQLIPPITAKEAEESVKLLQELGMLCPDTSGRLRPSSHHLSTGKRWMSAAIQQYQKETLLLSLHALERVPRNQRDISTLTLSLDSSCLAEIQEVLSECRQTIIGIVDRMPAQNTDAVYQLNLQFIPLSVIQPSDNKRRRLAKKDTV